jgi:hypothetical protein
MYDIKHQVLSEIEKNVDVFKKTSNIQYRIRCPICGDSQKNPKDAHCYIKCSDDPAEPLLYNCFKCNSGGRVDQEFLSKLGINKTLTSQLSKQRYSRIGTIKKMDIDLVTGTPIIDSPQTRYIEYRLGKGFEYDDYDRFKIIWNIDEIRNHITDKRVLNTLPSMNDSISFLSDDRSCILIRSFIGDDCRWRKIKIINSNSKSFYTIKSTIDLFTPDTITVNIAEGVMDVLSVYKNFNDGINSVYSASLGSDYISALEYMMMKGFVGKNIIIKIYIDSDINDKALKYQLKKYRWLFNKIILYKNIKSKDVGVPIDQIKLVEINI